MLEGSSGQVHKQKKEGCNLLKIAVIAACVTIVLCIGGCVAAIINFFVGDSWRFMAPVTYSKMKIHSYPNKTVYIVGEEYELDLTGGFVCVSRDTNGKGTEADEFPCEEGKCEGECVFEITEGIERGYMEVISDLDFEHAGTYSVVLRMDNDDMEPLECSFPIQVISADYVE